VSASATTIIQKPIRHTSGIGRAWSAMALAGKIVSMLKTCCTNKEFVAVAGEQRHARANPVELARIWNSVGLHDLRDALPPFEQEKLRNTLAAVLSGETSPAVWRATVNALAALRRASEPAVGAPRRWRQSWPAAEEW
jgi:hypothetical protein